MAHEDKTFGKFDEAQTLADIEYLVGYKDGAPNGERRIHKSKLPSGGGGGTADGVVTSGSVVGTDIILERSQSLPNVVIDASSLGGGGGNQPQIFQAYNAAYSNNNSDLVADLTKRVWGKHSAYDFDVTDWKFDVDDAPTGSVIELDVKKNGTSIFTTKPTIAIGAKISSGAVLVTSSVNFPIGSYIEVFITKVGSTIPGKGLSGDPIGTLN